jgi:hypothetical protein
MNLPTIDHPILNIEVPSLKKKFRFRPFLVKEEKVLLMAKESKDDADIFTAVKQVVENCSLDNKLKIDKLALFDLEYLFLKIRASSVDNKINVGYRDNEDNKIYNFEVDLNEIKVVFPVKNDNTIKITDNIGLVMCYPQANLYADKDFLTTEREHLFKLIVRCIDKVYEGDQVYETSNFTKEQLEVFLENLDIRVFDKVHQFLLNTPKIEHVIEYENSNGNKRKITLNSLNDFFTWR